MLTNNAMLIICERDIFRVVYKLAHRSIANYSVQTIAIHNTMCHDKCGKNLLLPSFVGD